MMRRVRLGLEILEERTVLAAALFADGVVSITGTTNADVLRIWQDQGDLVVEGADFRIAIDLVQSIEARLDAGNDVLTNETSVPMTAWGGSGADTLIGGSGDDVLFGEDWNDRIFGGDGDDVLTGHGILLLDGGAGDDILEGQTTFDRIENGSLGYAFFATPENDVIILSDSNKRLVVNGVLLSWAFMSLGFTVYGMAGNDLIVNHSSFAITIDGGDGRDRLIGGGGNDTLVGGADSDLLLGRGGNDRYLINTVLEGSERDFVLEVPGGQETLDFSGVTADAVASFAGASGRVEHAGRSLVYRGGVPTVIVGGSGNDTIASDSGLSQQLFGGAGNDILSSGSANDFLDGGAGNDVLRGGEGNDEYIFGTDSTTGEVDQIDDADSSNVLRFNYGVVPFRADLSAPLNFVTSDFRTIQRTTGGFTEFWANKGRNTILGTAGTDVIRAKGTTTDAQYLVDGADGDDILEVSTPSSTLIGGAGNDILRNGGSFSSYLYGGTGNDFLQGGDSSDVLSGDEGDDILDGGGGDDRFLFGVTGPEHETDTILDSDQSNLLDFTNAVNGLDIDLGASLSISKNGFRTVNRESAGFTIFYGNGQIRGTEGPDTIKVITSTDSGYIFIDAMGGDDVIDFVGANSEIHGGAGNDKITGGTKTNLIWGDDGDDIIVNQGRDSTIEGGGGNDIITGGSYHDWIHGGDGDDVIHGDPLSQLIAAYNPQQYSDNLFGGAGDDIIHGGLGNDHIEGNDGDDQLNGGWDSDELFGGAGNDILAGGISPSQAGDAIFIGPKFYGDGDDILHGGDGNDDLTGSFGADQLIGDDGDDVLHSDANDTLLP